MKSEEKCPVSSKRLLSNNILLLHSVIFFSGPHPLLAFEYRKPNDANDSGAMRFKFYFWGWAKGLQTSKPARKGQDGYRRKARALKPKSN